MKNNISICLIANHWQITALLKAKKKLTHYTTKSDKLPSILKIEL